MKEIENYRTELSLIKESDGQPDVMYQINQLLHYLDRKQSKIMAPEPEPKPRHTRSQALAELRRKYPLSLSEVVQAPPPPSSDLKGPSVEKTATKRKATIIVESQSQPPPSEPKKRRVASQKRQVLAPKKITFGSSYAQDVPAKVNPPNLQQTPSPIVISDSDDTSSNKENCFVVPKVPIAKTKQQQAAPSQSNPNDSVSLLNEEQMRAYQSDYDSERKAIAETLAKHQALRANAMKNGWLPSDPSPKFDCNPLSEDLFTSQQNPMQDSHDATQSSMNFTQELPRPVNLSPPPLRSEPVQKARFMRPSQTRQNESLLSINDQQPTLFTPLHLQIMANKLGIDTVHMADVIYESMREVNQTMATCLAIDQQFMVYYKHVFHRPITTYRGSSVAGISRIL